MNIEVKKIASNVSGSVSENTYKPKIEVPEPRYENEIDIHENNDNVHALFLVFYQNKKSFSSKLFLKQLATF